MPSRCHRVSVVATSILAAGLLTGGASAGGPASWTLQVIEDGSSTGGTGTLQSDLAGSLIGDFDPETNPGGTLTRPGIFGGSGNLPVDVGVELALDGTLAATVSGGLELAGDLEVGTISVAELQLDLLNDAVADFPLTATLLFETFRTFNPDSLFPGGIAVPVPIGEASLTQLDVQQAAPAFGTAVSTGSGTWAITIDVPVVLLAEFTALEQAIASPPIPALLPLAGELVLDGKGGATVSLSFAAAAGQDEDLPKGDPLFDGLPFGLPTVLPAGATANILLTLSPSSLMTNLNLDVAFDAATIGGPSVPGDVNGDGIADFEDVLLVLAGFGACPPAAPCPADLDQSESVDFTDLLLVLANYSG